MDLVSIIVPVYNMEHSLEKAMLSVLEQDYKNIEIILVDDGSKDDSLRVCRKFAESDERIRVIHTENQGSGPARNEGIKVSRGKYLYFPDADDFLAPDAISILVKAMNDNACDLVVFGYRTLNQNGETVSEKIYKKFQNSGDNIRSDYSNYLGMESEYGIQGAPWNKFFDGSVVREKGIFYPALRRHQDEAFISRYMTHCKKVTFIPDVLYTYYANSVSLEWKKYPVDYLDAVTGLEKIWRETIFAWNPADTKTARLAEKKIFFKLIKVLELSYSPKMEFNFSKRLKWLKNTCKATGISKYSLNTAGSMYQKCLLLCAKAHLYLPLMGGLYVGTLKNRKRKG